LGRRGLMNPVADSHLQVAKNYRDYALASESGPGNLNTRQGNDDSRECASLSRVRDRIMRAAANQRTRTSESADNQAVRCDRHWRPAGYPEDVLKFHHPQGTRRGRTVGLPEDSIRKITALLRSSGAKPIVGTQQEPNTNGED
jgi:hypothetical protein